MKNTRFKAEGDDVAVTKEENNFPFPETEIALRQKLKCTSSALLDTTNFYMKTKK